MRASAPPTGIKNCKFLQQRLQGGGRGTPLGGKAVLTPSDSFLSHRNAMDGANFTSQDGAEVTGVSPSVLALVDIANGAFEIEYVLLTHS